MEFDALTVFVLANNETSLLRNTIESIDNKCNHEDLERIIIVSKSQECPAYFEGKQLAQSNQLVELYIQKSATVQLCLAELPPLVTSSHFVIMAADMEMDPSNLSDFISKAKIHPNRIICAAKWMKESTVIGYGTVHALCSKSMNKIISFLFNKKVYDPFSIYQIYPVDLYKRMKFDNPETFLYEYTLKPLSLGEEYEEVPTVYNKREYGKSNFKLSALFIVATKFLFTGFRIRFKIIGVKSKCNRQRKKTQ